MSKTTTQEPIHPGAYVREHILPNGLTVTAAAKILGVGRPALSNFLNSKAALSPEMARRLERTFGADSQALLNLQARFGSPEKSAQAQLVAAGTYAPPVHSIRARQLEHWANDIDTRQKLPALLRRLIHSTGQNLTHVDFPAYNNAERKGWDGIVETSTPTPWIPAGKSGWEFGCNKNPKSKADKAFSSRRSIPQIDRAERTFVFITPRNWPGKNKWVTEAKTLWGWKDVRAYDASDLEQWLEQSASAQIWLAEQLGMPLQGYRLLEQCWSTWASASDPELSPTLFDPAIKNYSRDFKNWLTRPPGRLFTITADSRDEALAFLACLAQDVEFDSVCLSHRAIVFDTPAALRRLASAWSSSSFVVVVHSSDVESELSTFYRDFRCVVVRPRNTVNAKPDIALEAVGEADFEKALMAMGLSHSNIERLARESARSPTILRRRLSNILAVQTPNWAGDGVTARKLFPATMVGTWHNASSADREVVRLLACSDDGTVANNVAEMLTLEDPPLWSAGEYRGVVSRIDALFGISEFITETDLENFFLVAEYVLAELDPAIELSEDKQWLAVLHGKVRNHSAVLRCGIRETLVILAVHGNRLFLQRLGFDAEAQVADLVSKLLNPLDREKIRSYNADLPDYAEAAPEEVLSLLEDDLRKPEPVIRELMRPAEHSFFGTPLRTHLLWTLEGLAWSSQRFPRVVELLAKLCTMGENEVRDNWVNKPENTLGSLFRAWWPQTAATINERILAFEKLCRDYPSSGWPMCLAQLESKGIAIPNHRPHWRNDGADSERMATEAEHEQFVHKALDLVRTWPRHDEKTLGDLVQRLEQFSDEDQLQVWNLIDQWAATAPSEDAKAILRQRIHGCAHMRHRRNNSIVHPEHERAALEKLLPSDITTRHAWLFTSHWVKLPPNVSENEEFDHKKNAQRLHAQRLKALREIWEQGGFEDVSALLEKVGQEYLIGHCMTEVLAGQCEAVEFVKSCLRAATRDTVYRSCLTGFLGNVGTGLIAAIINEIECACKPDTFLTLLLCMPFGATPWRYLDNKPTDFRDAYWKRVEPRIWIGVHGEEEINESIGRLLAVRRVSVAFRVACVAWDQVETSQLIRLLHAMPTADLEDFLKDPLADYYISEAFDELDKRTGVTVEEKAQLEYAHFTLLDRSEHGIPNLEKQIATSPGLYAWAIACVFKRVGGGEDPPELRFSNPERRSELARVARQLLDRIRRLPGTDRKKNIDAGELKAWIGEVRLLCARHDRTTIGDHMIGQFLARAPADDDGVWPCRPVCEALEWMASEEIDHGFQIGTKNRRGAYLRALYEGGDQERNLAARCRGWSRKLVYQYPHVGGVLERIASSYDHEAGRQDTESDIRQRLSFL